MMKYTSWSLLCFSLLFVIPAIFRNIALVELHKTINNSIIRREFDSPITIRYSNSLGHLKLEKYREIKSPIFQRLIGGIYFAQNKYRKAVEIFDEARMRYSHDPALAWDAALIYEHLDKEQNSIGSYFHVKMLESWQDTGLDAHSFIQQGENRRFVFLYSDALRAYQRAIIVDPMLGDPWYYQGQLYEDLKLWKQALQSYQRGIQAQSWRIGLSNLYYRIGVIRGYHLSPPDPQGSWVAYEKALDLDDFGMQIQAKTDMYFQRGHLLYHQQLWWQALEEYHYVLKLEPHHYFVHMSIADCLWMLGEREHAKAELRTAIKLDPQIKEGYLWLGKFYAREGRNADANSMFTKVLELDSNDETARSALAP